ncbi:MAG: presenilin family intramembrane aspartyl protease PSH [Methanocellales archaeon]|nr:presenilin family intramembrane aspartyl protease PSH [Methanocellales archaeon]
MRSKTIANYLPFICMSAFLIIVQVLALLLTPQMIAHEMQAFEDPQSVWNPIWYMGLILLFTLATLFIIKLKLRWVFRAFIMLAIWSTLWIVLFGLLIFASPLEISVIGSLLGASILTVLVYKFPEWYVIDVTGVLIGAGVTAIFGISLAIAPTLLLLIGLAVYDAVAVYKTKHMIALAEGMMELRLPVIFVVPKRRGYSFLKDEPKKGERGAYFMGLGDAVIPSILVVSAKVFTVPPMGFLNLPALGTIIGTLIGFGVLAKFVAKGKPQPGLPFLNTGAIIGFTVGCLSAGVL